MLAGDNNLSLVEETSLPQQTFHRWKHQALVDQGLVDGANSAESAQLLAESKHFSAQEEELQLLKDTSELFDA